MDGKHVLLLLTLSLTVLIANIGHAEAQEAEGVEIRLTADRRELAVGDLVELTLRAAYPEGYQAIFPRLPKDWGGFEVRDQSQVEITANPDGTETMSQVIEVTLFAPGTFETPELSVALRDPGGQVIEQRLRGMVERSQQDIFPLTRLFGPA